MGLFDYAKSLAGEYTEHAKTLEAITMLVSSKESLVKLKQAFETHQLGATFQSWVARGANMPISAAQIRSVLGDSQVEAIAKKVGMTPEELQQKLASTLPRIVDALSPNGQLSHESFSLSNLISAGKQIFSPPENSAHA